MWPLSLLWSFQLPQITSTSNRYAVNPLRRCFVTRFKTSKVILANGCMTSVSSESVLLRRCSYSIRSLTQRSTPDSRTDSSWERFNRIEKVYLCLTSNRRFSIGSFVAKEMFFALISGPRSLRSARITCAMIQQIRSWMLFVVANCSIHVTIAWKWSFIRNFSVRQAHWYH